MSCPIRCKTSPFPRCRLHVSTQALDEMQVQGHRPDVGIYNIALEVLARSGVLSAQLKAAQLFQTASRQGQLRCDRNHELLSPWRQISPAATSQCTWKLGCIDSLVQSFLGAH